MLPEASLSPVGAEEGDEVRAQLALEASNVLLRQAVSELAQQAFAGSRQATRASPTVQTQVTNSGNLCWSSAAQALEQQQQHASAASVPSRVPQASSSLSTSSSLGTSEVVRSERDLETTISHHRVNVDERLSNFTGMQRRTELLSDEVKYLRKDVEHLRRAKHGLEEQVRSYETRTCNLEQQLQHYKSLYERSMAEKCSHDSGMEFAMLKEQLGAVAVLKDELNRENINLHGKLHELRKEKEAEAGKRHGECAICMDELANTVCLPCKHMALCSTCAANTAISACPICRTDIKERMQIFLP